LYCWISKLGMDKDIIFNKETKKHSNLESSASLFKTKWE
jgi:hypothetical protein